MAKMSVNEYHVDWDEGDRSARCIIGAECLKGKTRGRAVFYHNNREIDRKHCCMACAMSECTRIGLHGAIVVKRTFS